MIKKVNIRISALFIFAAFLGKAQVVTTTVNHLPNDANGIGSAAHFYNPCGVVADGIGNLYVVDAGNNEIRKIVISTGAVTTLAGNPTNGSADGIGTAASFNAPSAITIDGSGNLFVADEYNNEIRKIVISTGAVTTLAGSTTSGSADGTGAAAGFNSPSGLVADGGGNLFVADKYNNEIRKVVISSGVVTTLAGTTSSSWWDGTGSGAAFYYPSGIAFDGTGNLYVTEVGSNKIRQVVISSAVVTSIAGPTFGTTGSFADGTGTAARFYDPSGIVADGSGNLYVADRHNNAIRKIVISTGAVTTFAGTTTAGWVDGTGTAANFNEPFGITLDGGNLYVADAINNEIRKVVISSALVSSLAGSTTALSYPTGVVADGLGNLYVADKFNYKIRKVVISTGIVTTVAGTGAYGNTDGIGAAASFDNPVGIAYYAGNLYVTDQNNNEIRKIDISTGVVSTFAGSTTAGSLDGTGVSAKFNYPSGIISDGLGNLYVADMWNNQIRKIVISTGVVTTLAGSPSGGSADGTGAAAQFANPVGLAVDGLGNLFVADTYNNEIRKIIISTAVVTTLAGSTVWGSADGIGAAAVFNLPTGIVADASGNLYVADQLNNDIRRVVISTAAVTTFAGTTTMGNIDGTGSAARFYHPYGITMDITGDLYVVEENDDVRKISMLSTGINDEQEANIVSLFPNPGKGLFTLNFGTDGLTMDNYKVEIYNSLGQKVLSQFSISNSRFTVDISSQHSGIYSVQIMKNNQFIKTLNFIKE